FIAKVNALSKGLLHLGIRQNDRVAIMSPNRLEWNICDFGIIQIGATQVPMYPTLAENDIRFITQDADIKLIFVSDAVLYQKLLKVKEAAGLGYEMYSFDEVEGIPCWKEIVRIGEESGSGYDLQQYRNKIGPDDLL